MSEGRGPVPLSGWAGGSGRCYWLVDLGGERERIEADEAEITASGALAFYRAPVRVERGRTLIVAFAPGLWSRCQIEQA